MEFIYLPVFIKRLKTLSKKYPSLKQEFASLLNILQNYPQTGVSLGQNCYKIRLAISSKGRGKSGGARVITCVKVENNSIFFLTIYDKSEQETLSEIELKVFIDYIRQQQNK